MMEQLKVLRRIKELREERAFRAVHAKRLEVMEAEAVHNTAKRAALQSEATLPAREDAIFKPIIRHVVGFDDVETAKADIQVLQKDHTKLVDSAERAAHVKKRLEKQLAEAIEAHRKTMSERDKYVMLSDEVASELKVEAAHREEVDIEDLLISPRRSSYD